MANTLQEVREQGGYSVEKVFRRMLAIAPDPDRVPALRTLARVEKEPIAQVDRLTAATFLRAIGTSIEAEFPHLAAIARLEAALLTSDPAPTPEPTGAYPPEFEKAA
jgi:hypothetical protein